MSRGVIAGVSQEEIMRVACAEIDVAKEENQTGGLLGIWKAAGQNKVRPKLFIEILFSHRLGNSNAASVTQVLCIERCLTLVTIVSVYVSAANCTERNFWQGNCVGAEPSS